MGLTPSSSDIHIKCGIFPASLISEKFGKISLGYQPPPSKVYDLLPNFSPDKIAGGGKVKMSRLFSLAVGAVLVVVTVMFCLAGFGEAQVKPADPGLLPELSLYAGSKSCIECHGKFYQLWSTSRHGLGHAALHLGVRPDQSDAPDESAGYRQDTSYRADIGPQAGWILETDPKGKKKKYSYSPRPGWQGRLLFPDPVGAGTPADPAGGL